MSVELASRNESLDINQENLREVAEVLVQRGEMEVVTTASGEILYVLQSSDE
jgi:hypothetical protein